MKLKPLIVAVATLLIAGSWSLAQSDDEVKYTQAIEKRTADIISALDLKDQAKVGRVHDAIIAQYRALRDWQEKNEAAKKNKDTAAQEQLKKDRKMLHDQFLPKLNADLTPEQVDVVKDKLTYNKVKVTYDAYVEMIPTLTTEQKAKVMDFLKQAREEAMDGVSSEEKSAIFKKYKGKINNYFVAQGIDEKKARKEWDAKRKANNAPATNPAGGD
jgi:hypothetical protein